MSQLTIMPEPVAYQPYNHWLVKFLDCAFVGLGVVDFFDSLIILPATFLPNRHLVMTILAVINTLLMAAAVAFVIIYPLRWHRRETRLAAVDSPLRHAWLTGIIRYWLAAVILNYGFAKIFGTQFAPNYFRGDSTFSSLSGFDLTWGYFGYSYTMSVIIALIQIVACFFLFFRRTTMLGILLLLPVMVNISLIDVFYGIAGGATANAILFTVALTYLLALQWPAIREFFRQTRSGLPAIRGNIAKNLLRLALTTWAIGFIAYVASRKEPAAFTGKWRVDQLVRNHHTYAPDDWVIDSLDWKYIYLEQFGRATFSPNPLVVDPRSTKAIYSVDPGEQSMRVTLLNRPLNRSAADTALVKLTTSSTGHMQWTLIDNPDTIDLSLTKIDMTH